MRRYLRNSAFNPLHLSPLVQPVFLHRLFFRILVVAFRQFRGTPENVFIYGSVFQFAYKGSTLFFYINLLLSPVWSRTRRHSSKLPCFYPLQPSEIFLSRAI